MRKIELYYCNGNIWKNKKKSTALLIKEQCNSVLIAVWKTQNEARAFVKLSSITHINWQCTPGINWSERGIWQLWQIGMLSSEKREHAEQQELFFIFIIYPARSHWRCLDQPGSSLVFSFSPNRTGTWSSSSGMHLAAQGNQLFPKWEPVESSFHLPKPLALWNSAQINFQIMKLQFSFWPRRTSTR